MLLSPFEMRALEAEQYLIRWATRDLSLYLTVGFSWSKVTNDPMEIGSTSIGMASGDVPRERSGADTSIQRLRLFTLVEPQQQMLLVGRGERRHVAHDQRRRTLIPEGVPQ